MRDLFGGRATLPGIGLTACVVALMATASNAQNLLVNGSFETGTFTGTNPQSVSNSTDLAPGSTNMTGWTTIAGAGVADVAWLQNGNPYGLLATDGVRSLDLTGYQDSAPYGGVTQTLTLIKGNTYTLSFDIISNQSFSPDFGPMSVQASVGNLSQLFTFTPPTGSIGLQFGTETATFIATTASTTLTLTGVSTAGGQYLGLDNAKITGSGAAAPEPASLVLASAAALPLVGALRRRRAGR